MAGFRAKGALCLWGQIMKSLPPLLRRALLDLGYERESPRSRRIFTNRDLDFDSIKAVGFDMDYTLALYRQDALEELSIETTIEKLVAKGYPEELKKMKADPTFAVRGLVVDKELGNLLKMDRHGYVGRAYHGKVPLSRPDRKAIYRAQRIGQERERFAFVDTMFSLPEVTIFAEVVALLDRAPELWSQPTPSYAEAWKEVRESIDEAHRDDSIKSRIKANPEKYIWRDPELGLTLHKLRSAGKKLFLLTNSFYPFSDAVMTYLLNDDLEAYEDWKAYFDWIVVGSMKPRFFTKNELFFEIDDAGKTSETGVGEPIKGRVYQGGNQTGLQTRLGVEADEVLYVGDHIYGDVVKSKKSSGWRTVLVVEELEHELMVRDDHRIATRELESLAETRDHLTEEISAQRHLQRLVAKVTVEDLVAYGLDEAEAKQMLKDAALDARSRYDRLREHEEAVYEVLQKRNLEVDSAFNPYWGSIFAERLDASMFGAQLEHYACLYTGRVSNFLYVSMERYFHAPHGDMPHWRRH